LPSGLLLRKSIRDAVLGQKCEHCDKLNRGRTPGRPVAALPSILSPGESQKVEIGYFKHPQGNMRSALIAVDRYSALVEAGAMPSGRTPSAKDTLEKYLDMLSIIYNQVTYLGSNFDSTLWRNFMDRLRSMVRSVPGHDPWPNAAEKPVELVRTGLAGVWDSFPYLPFRSALKFAFCQLNENYRPSFKASRLSMHLGVPLKKLSLLEPPLFSLNPIAMPPSLKDLEGRLDATDGRRKDVNSIRACTRLSTFTRAQLTRQRTNPVQINNGDFFMFWKSSTSKNQTGYKRPAI
jgi:hypothetical protein